MATQAQLDILNQMAKFEGSFKAAQVKKNPFGECKIPIGTYVFKLGRAALTLSGPAGKPKTPGVQIVYVCQAKHDDGDQQFFGEQIKVQRKIGATDKTSVDESWERLIYDLQDLGVETENLILRGTPSEGQFTLLELLDFLTSSGMFIKGDIVKSDKDAQGRIFTNLNNVRRMSTAELDEFFGAGNYDVPSSGEEDVSTDEIRNAPEGDGQVDQEDEYEDADYNPDGAGTGGGGGDNGDGAGSSGTIEAFEDGSGGYVDGNGSAVFWNEDRECWYLPGDANDPATGISESAEDGTGGGDVGEGDQGSDVPFDPSASSGAVHEPAKPPVSRPVPQGKTQPARSPAAAPSGTPKPGNQAAPSKPANPAGQPNKAASGKPPAAAGGTAQPPKTPTTSPGNKATQPPKRIGPPKAGK